MTDYAELGEREFYVTEVVPIDPPEGASDDNWFRYTLEHGSSPITGIRPGTLRSVRRHAEEFAESLNQRALGNTSTHAMRRGRPKGTTISKDESANRS